MVVVFVGLLIAGISYYKFNHVSLEESLNATSQLLIENNSTTSYFWGGHRFDVPVNYQYSHTLFHGAPSTSKSS